MKTSLVCLLIASFTFVGDVCGDAKSAIAGIERLPRSQRPQAYETAIAVKGITGADRLELIRAFSKHAEALSPVYSKEKFPFDEQAWTAILRQGFEADPRDANIALALAQLYIDRRDHRAALPVVKAFKEAHAEHHHALAWLAWCEARQAKTPPAATPTLTFPVHFCVLTRNPAAHKLATPEQCRKECEILNATFRTLDGKPLARFEFKGYASYEQVKATQSELAGYGDRETAYDTDSVAKAFNACADRKLRDPQAINFYIFDSHSPKTGFRDQTSHGKRNSNRPFVLVDWERLNGRTQNAEAHEMGHAFGLEHVGVPGATETTSTNIMTSAGEQFGSGGKRDLGFSPAQSALILHHAKRTSERLRLAK